ncbi:unnamed protein product [Caenorhabditis angaria]|uniref:Seven TM Receptor n=1 Tax=Caenorhabditis angaria TaxID=860376 RepID=A0A9P1N762_9PELO|nr:unnamed protein product [Caenorhabditis angaria]
MPFLHSSIKIKSFNDYRIIFWMSIPIVTGIFWGIMTETLIGPTVQIDNAIENILLSDFDTHIEDVTYIGPYLYQKQVDGSIQVDIKSFVCLIVMVAIILLSMGLIVVSAFKCFLGLNVYLEVNRNVSKKYNSLQVQLFNALIIQTLIPILLMHLPCLTIFVCAIFEIDLGHSSVVMTITTALFPALDPLPVMLIIKDYRNALTNIVITRVVPVKKKKKKSRNENATNNF